MAFQTIIRLNKYFIVDFTRQNTPDTHYTPFFFKTSFRYFKNLSNEAEAIPPNFCLIKLRRNFGYENSHKHHKTRNYNIIYK